MAADDNKDFPFLEEPQASVQVRFDWRLILLCVAVVIALIAGCSLILR